jgi:1-acyl-sn-glycerol-3-phosphate acyltransferase
MGRIAAFLARLVLRATARVRTEGFENLPTQGPLIIVANHISNADPPLVFGWPTPAVGRQMHILAKEALFVGPVGWFLRKNGVTPVKSGGSDIEAYRVAKGVLDRGEVLCIFPEGTRSPTGVMQEPKPGVAMLGTRSGVPIVAVGISGSDSFLGRGKRMPRFGTRITVRAGEPFTLELDPALPRRQAMAQASDDIMRRIAALVEERHRGRFGAAQRVTEFASRRADEI